MVCDTQPGKRVRVIVTRHILRGLQGFCTIKRTARIGFALISDKRVGGSAQHFLGGTPRTHQSEQAAQRVMSTTWFNLRTCVCGSLGRSACYLANPLEQPWWCVG